MGKGIESKRKGALEGNLPFLFRQNATRATLNKVALAYSNDEITIYFSSTIV
jgi:hypothetical protein